MIKTLRRDEFTAEFLARECLLFDKNDALACRGKPDSGGRARGTGTDDGNVIFFAHLPESTSLFALECSTFTSDTPACFASCRISSAVKLRRIDSAPSSLVNR